MTSLDEAPWTMVRQRSDEPARLTLHAQLGDESAELVRLIRGETGAYVDDVGRPGVAKPLVLGFSARRRIARPGENPKAENPDIDRVRGLFDPNYPLLAGDAFGSLETKSEQRAFAGIVREVVLHELSEAGDRLFPLIDVIELRGQGGITTNTQLLEQRRFVLRYGDSFAVRVAVAELSDGYQAMLSMVLEILVQATIAKRSVIDPSQLEAIVLIDEVEAHLHPRWQRTVVPLLREVFPRCQFVATTHSPLVVGSAKSGEVQVLHVHADGDVRVQVLEESLSGLVAEEIYESVFGVARTSPPDYVAKERRYLEAKANSRPIPGELRAYVEEAWRDRRTILGDE